MWSANATTANERRETNAHLLSWPECGELKQQTVELRHGV